MLRHSAVAALRLGFAASARADLPSASVGEITAQGSGVGPRVGAARIVLTAPAIAFQGGREVGERFGDRAFVAGWAESPAGPGRVEIGGAEVGVGGAFALELARPATSGTRWTVEIRARFPDGAEVVRSVDLDRDGAAELLRDQVAAAVALSDDARFGREGRSSWGSIARRGDGPLLLRREVLRSGAGAVGERRSPRARGE
ncbi:MAG TPA: hypothetical protein VFL83_16735 [Anaeromyxobacter sp.]|nr:hypothetical protein [Anaeromyxobacter sp.]